MKLPNSADDGDDHRLDFVRHFRGEGLDRLERLLKGLKGKEKDNDPGKQQSNGHHAV